MANISEFRGSIEVSKKVIKLDSFRDVFKQWRKIKYDELQYGIEFQDSGYLFNHKYIYQIIGKGRWSFDLSVNLLFSNCCDRQVYQQFLRDLEKINQQIKFSICEYEPGAEILDEENGSLKVVKNHQHLELIVDDSKTQYESYAYTVKNRVALSFEKGKYFGYEDINEIMKVIARLAFPNKKDSINRLLDKANSNGLSNELLKNGLKKVLFDKNHRRYLIKTEWEDLDILFSEIKKVEVN